MSEQQLEVREESTRSHSMRDRIVSGVVLIAIGVLVFLAQVLDQPELTWLIVPALGVIFLVWGLLVREIGFLIPGGILTGIGAGLYMMIGPMSDATREVQPGVFLLCFAAGWVLITLLSPITREGFQWWPLIPGAILALVGVALIGGGVALEILKVLGYAWPLILVGAGIYLLLRRRE